MRKADGILMITLMFLCIVCLGYVFLMPKQSTHAVVSVKDQEVLRLDLSKEGQYEVEGTNGLVHIEVKDGKVRVTQENSPNHYCSKQGFTNSSAIPIVCLPNETVVTIEGAPSEEDAVIS